jgi:hypothetical protein
MIAIRRAVAFFRTMPAALILTDLPEGAIPGSFTSMGPSSHKSAGWYLAPRSLVIASWRGLNFLEERGSGAMKDSGR